MSGYEDFDDFHDDWPEGAVVCDRCNGDGEVDCHCGGDLCVCGAGEITCQVCHGEGWITKERWQKRAAAHREMMEVLWGKSRPPANSGDETPPPSTEQPKNPTHTGAGT